MGRITKEQSRQKTMEVYETIKDYIRCNGRAPTEQEIIRLCGLPSKSHTSVRRHLQKLRAMGYIRMAPRKKCNITIVPPEERETAKSEWEERGATGVKAGKGKGGQAQPAPVKATRKCLYPATVFTKVRPQNCITHLKPGDIIREKTGEKDKGCTYRVLRVYPYHVSCVESGTGFLKSFSLGDLITMNLECQCPEIEARRKLSPEGRSASK